MDFDRAAERLAKDQSKLRQARRRYNSKGLSNKAQKEVEYRKRQYELKKQEQSHQKRKEQAGKLLLQKCHSKFSSNSHSNFQNKVFTECTSIHGEGDKIALPPSTLQDLSDLFLNNNNNNNPIYFRVGIRNPNYSFPASHGLKQYMEQQSTETKPMMTTDNDDSDDDDDDDDDQIMTRIYLEELSHEYYTYTHATVVEFTQEEGCIGLPKSISSVLLDPTRLLCHRSQDNDKQPLIPSIPHTQTIDPSSSNKQNDNSSKDDGMDVDSDNNGEGTAGHVAYGAFHVPNLPVEITLLSSLPKGKKCTLCPTPQAIRDGFYNLKDVKLVLEQSLIRTRATLTLGDPISTWHRGKKYNLIVTELKPSSLGVVSCINTDLEVDFASPPDNTTTTNHASTTQSYQNSDQKLYKKDAKSMVGYRLGGNKSHNQSIKNNKHMNNESRKDMANTTSDLTTTMTKIELPPEPPISNTNGNITIQIQSFDGSKNKRRFDRKTNTLKHVFDFASNHCGLPSNNFRLVQRYPKQIFETPNDNTSMEELNFGKQEMIFIERI